MTTLSKFTPTISLLSKGGRNVFIVVSKRDGHARRFIIRPGRSIYWRFADQAHFYSLLGWGFWGSILFYLNVVYGACELREIPAGYEPRYWEYEDKPLTQLISKFLGFNPMKEHEKMVGMYKEEEEKREWRLQEERVRHLVFERGDYKAWYYVPYKAKWAEYTNWRFQKRRDNIDPVKGMHNFTV